MASPGNFYHGMGQVSPNYGGADEQLGLLNDPGKVMPGGEGYPTELQPQEDQAAPLGSFQLTPLKRVAARLVSTERSLDAWRRKNYQLRKVVAGDFSLVMGDADAARQDGPDEEVLQIREFYHFIVTSFTEGRSNKLLWAVKTLLQQVAYTFPNVEANDMDAMEAAFHAGWCKERLGDSAKGTALNEESGMALLDYIIGGLGWVKACWRDRPDGLFCDSLDMMWDRTATTFRRMRWASCTFREPLHVWMEMFPKYDWTELAGDALTNPDQAAVLDNIYEAEFYYDVEGEAGSYYAILKREGYEEEAVMDSGPNPYYVIEQETRRPFIPYTPMHFMRLPSVAAPVGVVEMMFPDQIALWEAENSVRQTTKRGVAYFDVEEGAYEGEARKQLEDGDIGSLIERKKGSPPAQRVEPLEVSKSLMDWVQMKETAIKEHSGVNPYSSGTPQDVNYAREVDEIAGQSGLTTGTVSKDYAHFWVQLIRALVAIGALYDDLPLTIVLEGVMLQFGPSNPASKFLIPDADFVVREDTMTYRPRQQKIAEALQDLQVAMQLSSVFPNAVALAYENYKRAQGEQNLQKWLQQAPPPPAAPPGMAPGPGGPPAAAPGQPPKHGGQASGGPKPPVQSGPNGALAQRPASTVPPASQIGTPQSAVATAGA